ncbi:ABC transporter permease [Paenibacillus sambharensis]|uniref:ABC transporter permease n=1 Tax=Paenibacillus sambharensis TaxID=1803190 RepID=A0A2W1LLS6_9BACL|nr:ABC transporter permease [Paenibacillus sambharensis]PZD95464.1 ABC transporter permease [Paenibacillus sambharensis]
MPGAPIFFYDIKLQVRHGFYTAYGLVCGIYILLLYVMPASMRETVNVLLTFSDPSALGFFFIGGLVLLERGQGIYDSLFVTPYRLEQYLISKTLSLTLLSVLSAVLIHVSVFGFTAGAGVLAAGTAFTSVFFTLLGLGVAVKSRSVNGFFFLSSFYSLPFMLPLLSYGGFIGAERWLLGWLPTWGSLVLLKSAFEPTAAGMLIQACLVLAFWSVLAFWWARRQFARYVLAAVGEGIQ